MAFTRCVFVTSFIIALVAVFVTVDICQPYRDQLKDITPPIVAVTMDFIADKIRSLSGSISEITTASSIVPKVLFTKEEIKAYDGSEGSKGLYLGILGRVFDVSKGAQHYGPGGGYSFFTGCDGTKAFVTGKFDKDGLTDDIRGLRTAELMDLQDWLDFYQKDYKYVGKVIGNFYDEDGNPTTALKEFKEGLKQAKKAKSQDEDDLRKYPSCNSEWSQASGSRVWCSDKSGGIERDWIGVPRVYHRPSKQTRCACIRTFGPPTDNPTATSDHGDLKNPNFRLYENCNPTAVTCKIATK